MKNNNFLEWITDEEISSKDLSVAVLRLDKIHPIVSGNKYYKLKYYLEEAINTGKETAVTFGGYYSNHIHATAFACREKGLKSVAFIRGIEPKVMNDTLKDCISFGMELKFIPSDEFENIQKNIIFNPPENMMVIPMGGYGKPGMKGAAEILSFEEANQFNYVVAASGTGTMAAGLLHSLHSDQQLIIISAVKNNFSIGEEIINLDDVLHQKKNQLAIHFDYHCGGYGRSNQLLIETMNKFYSQHNIPTDFVYTGKILLGFYDQLKNDYFKRGSKVLIIHSGGIQGNRSLEKGMLYF
ncbi:MAG: 1-aminocyclopropane-1-carboxylate deaminase/D-cysteine desulfhydrase [Chitinophagaceae bacterium]